MTRKKRGFTLIELLVVVMIIAILAAIAVPQYKRAVLKSRFNTVMPMAKSVADAQEVYYQGRQMYALSTDELDVTPIAAEGASIALAPAEQEEQYAYVAASRPQVPGARYIMVQKYSPRFAGTIQCEADATNEDALWLCEKGLNGTEIPGGSVNTTGGSYKTFLLAGDIGSDTFSNGTGEEENNNAQGGTPQPTVDAETQAKVDALLTSIKCTGNYEGYCHDNGDGTVLRCTPGYSDYDEQKQVCVPNHTPDIYFFSIEDVYNADGIMIEQRDCHTINSGRECADLRWNTYDSITGNQLSLNTRTCQTGVAINLDTRTCPDGKYDTSSQSNNQDYDVTNHTLNYCTTFGPHGECNPS